MSTKTVTKLVIVLLVFPTMAYLSNAVLGLLILWVLILLPDSATETVGPILLLVAQIIAIICAVGFCRTVWPKREAPPEREPPETLSP